MTHREVQSVTSPPQSLAKSSTHANWWERPEFLALLAVILVASRFLALTADPPTDMVSDYLFDEGWWAHNARQHAVFGRWIMDQHNNGLFWAPLYTGALRVVYEFAGCGLWQTRFLTALAGVLTCVMVYFFVRKSDGSRAALFTTLLLGTNYMWLTYNRTAFIETFQTAFIALTYLSVGAASRHRGWAIVGGVAYALAVLAKVTALTSLAGIGVFWVWQFLWPTDSVDSKSARRATLNAIVLFALSAAFVAAIVWLVLVRPHSAVVQAEIEHLAGFADGQTSKRGLVTLGLTLAGWPVRIVTSAFLLHAPLLLAGIVLVAVRQLVLPASVPTRTAQLCWCWLIIGALSIGVKEFDSDRRYLQLVPPLAVLLGIELSRSGLIIVSRSDLADPSTRGRRWLAFILVSIAVGFAVRAPLANALSESQIFSTWKIGSERGLGHEASAGLAWLLISLLALGGCVWGARWLPVRRVQIPAALVMTLIVGINLAKAGAYFSQISFHLAQASEHLVELSQQLPPEDRVVIGDAADTLGLGSDCFTFIIRDWPHLNSHMNLDGWDRFSPNLALTADVPVGYRHLMDLKVAPSGGRYGRITSIPLYVRDP